MSQEMHILYVSQLTPAHGHSVFADVCRTARARNAEHGIAGVLLFDGQRFMQWLCGAPEPVLRLMGSIRADPRHSAIEVLFEGALLPPHHLDPLWRAGFVEAEALDAFASVGGSDASEILAGLAHLMAQADLEPPLDVAALTGAPAGPGTPAAGINGRDRAATS